MRKSIRRRISGAIGLLILSPLLPFALLSECLRLTASAIDWLFDGRWLARKLRNATDKVEVWFGVDAETDYREWRERRGQLKILTEKQNAR